jgi:4-amino-4-deoxy-L-arabinose transferase-like glycosyltransferase
MPMKKAYSRKTFYCGLLCLFAAALLGTWLRIRAFNSSPRELTGYYSLAENLKATGVYAYPGSPFTPTAYRAPLYPAFLYPFVDGGAGGVSRAFAAQLAVFLLTLFLVWAVSAAAGGALGAGAASLLYALHPEAALYAASFEVEFFYGYLLACAAGWLYLAAESGRPRHYLGAVALVGLAIACKSPLFLFPLLLALPPFWKLWRAGRRLLPLALAAYLLLLPWVLRNQARFGEFIPLEKGAALGPVYTAVLGLPLVQSPKMAQDLFRENEGGELYGSGRQVFTLLEIAAQAPARYLSGLPGRLRAIAGAFPALLALAAAGLFFGRGRAGVRLIGALAAYFICMHSLVSFDRRFLVPLLPVLAMLCSLAVSGAEARLSGAGAGWRPPLRLLSWALLLAVVPAAAAYLQSVVLLASEGGQERPFCKGA